MDWMDIWTHLGYVQALCSAINATTQYNIWRNVPISLQDPRWRLQHLLFQTRDWSSQGVGIWGAVLSPRYFHLHQKQAFGVGILWLIWMCLVMEYIFKPRLGPLTMSHSRGYLSMWWPPDCLPIHASVKVRQKFPDSLFQAILGHDLHKQIIR